MEGARNPNLSAVRAPLCVGGQPAVVISNASWRDLEQHFPSKPEAPWLTLRGLYGEMDGLVDYQSQLTLSAGQTGLHISVPLLFTAWGKPITVPWQQISASVASRFGMPMARLSFGTPEVGSLTIAARSWERLSEQAPLTERLPPVTAAQDARVLVRVWLGLTLFFGTALYVVSQFVSGPALSLLFAYGLAAGGFGVLMLVHSLRQG